MLNAKVKCTTSSRQFIFSQQTRMTEKKLQKCLIIFSIASTATLLSTIHQFKRDGNTDHKTMLNLLGQIISHKLTKVQTNLQNEGDIRVMLDIMENIKQHIHKLEQKPQVKIVEKPVFVEKIVEVQVAVEKVVELADNEFIYRDPNDPSREGRKFKLDEGQHQIFKDYRRRNNVCRKIIYHVLLIFKCV